MQLLFKLARVKMVKKTKINEFSEVTKVRSGVRCDW